MAERTDVEAANRGDTPGLIPRPRKGRFTPWGSRGRYTPVCAAMRPLVTAAAIAA